MPGRDRNLSLLLIGGTIIAEVVLASNQIILGRFNARFRDSITEYDSPFPASSKVSWLWVRAGHWCNNLNNRVRFPVVVSIAIVVLWYNIVSYDCNWISCTVRSLITCLWSCLNRQQWHSLASHFSCHIFHNVENCGKLIIVPIHKMLYTQTCNVTILLRDAVYCFYYIFEQMYTHEKCMFPLRFNGGKI